MTVNYFFPSVICIPYIRFNELFFHLFIFFSVAKLSYLHER